jgi:hypothetical protein
MKKLKKGDRIRLNTRTISGWKGIGTITEDQEQEEAAISFRKDGGTEENNRAMRHEVTLLKTNTIGHLTANRR